MTGGRRKQSAGEDSKKGGRKGEYWELEKINKRRMDRGCCTCRWVQYKRGRARSTGEKLLGVKKNMKKKSCNGIGFRDGADFHCFLDLEKGIRSPLGGEKKVTYRGWELGKGQKEGRGKTEHTLGRFLWNFGLAW